jgi:hypothetical protein
MMRDTDSLYDQQNILGRHTQMITERGFEQR